MENEEVIKSRGQGAFTVIFSVIIFGGLAVGFILASPNLYLPLISSILAILIIYFITGDTYYYSFYPDKVEIIYPYRKSKNRIILKEEIKFVRYHREHQTQKLTIFYKKGIIKDKISLRVLTTWHYIYDSPIYKILKRIKGWNVRLELLHTEKEIKSILE